MVMRGAFEDDESQIRFLNVDVDVWSRSSLQAVVDALGARIFVHHVGLEGREYGAHFSYSGSFQKDVDTLTRRLARLLKQLPPAARKAWDKARVRDFNVGIRSGIRPSSLEFAIKADTIKLVADIGARIVITTYSAQVAQAEQVRPLKKRAGRPTKR
jgi:hypothetical protein